MLGLSGLPQAEGETSVNVRTRSRLECPLVVRFCGAKLGLGLSSPSIASDLSCAPDSGR